MKKRKEIRRTHTISEKLINLRVTKADYEALFQKAVAEDRTLAAVVRRIVVGYLHPEKVRK